MGIFNEPPPERRAPGQDHATLLISWWCTMCAAFIIFVRIAGRYVRTERLFVEDKVMAWASVPLLIRMACVHVVLLYGTNNTQLSDLMSAEEIRRRQIGSKIVLASRIFYAMFIWVCKLTVLQFIKRLTSSTWSRRYELILRGIRIFLILTFIGVVIATLTECHPFHDYWQVVPNPSPSCRNGYAQLFVMGLSDIVTDVLIILIPFAVIISSTMPLQRKASLILLYSLSAFLIAIAAYRIPAIVASHGSQQRRSLWASIEILAAAATSNAVIIGSFVRDKGMKKSRFKHEREAILRSATGSEPPAINRTLTRQHWGNDSDEELFRTVRGRMNSLASDEAYELKRAIVPMPTILSPAVGPDAHGLDEDVEAHEAHEAHEIHSLAPLPPAMRANSGLGAPRPSQSSRLSSRPARTPRAAQTAQPSQPLHASETLALSDAGGLLGDGVPGTQGHDFAAVPALAPAPGADSSGASSSAASSSKVPNHDVDRPGTHDGNGHANPPADWGLEFARPRRSSPSQRQRQISGQRPSLSGSRRGSRPRSSRDDGGAGDARRPSSGHRAAAAPNRYGWLRLFTRDADAEAEADPEAATANATSADPGLELQDAGGLLR